MRKSTTLLKLLPFRPFLNSHNHSEREEGEERGAEGGGLQACGHGAGQDGARPRDQRTQRHGYNRRNRFEEVEGWNVPRNSCNNSPITMENFSKSLHEALRNINHHP